VREKAAAADLACRHLQHCLRAAPEDEPGAREADRVRGRCTKPAGAEDSKQRELVIFG
jgi:hypothetical protein